MITLYPEYQVPAYQRLVEHFKTNVAALLVMATGLGKTIVAAFWAKREYKRNRKGLFLCHDTGILDQAQNEFRKVMGNAITFKSFFGNEKDWTADQGDIVFATFQTLRETNPFFADEFDFVIVDESHHGQAPTYKEVINYFRPKKLLGITATPDREDMQDIREIFGDEVVDISLEEAVAMSWLSQVEYHILNDNLSYWKLKKIAKEVLEEGKKISLKQLNETIFIEARDGETAKTIMEYAGASKKTVIFCENIKHADNFQKFLPKSAVYHSKKSKDRNRQALQDFRDSNLQYILTVNKMNEGIDIPDAEIIVFLRCTDSKTIFFQQLGRGLRKIANKQKVVVLDFVANCERVAMVQNLACEIKKRVGNGFELTKDMLRISGNAFNFVFSDEQVDVLELIRKINHKLYVSDIPHLLVEYSPKNESSADKIVAGTNKKIWWICQKCYHEWLASGAKRVIGGGCPACKKLVVTEKNNLTITNPDLAMEYSPKNEFPAEKVIAGTYKKIWWTCLKCDYEWSATGRDRVRGNGCPACAGQVATEKVNLTVTHPDLIKEYSPKNELPADKVLAGTDKKIWWICSKCTHEWQARGYTRAKGSGCPECAKKRIATGMLGNKRGKK